MSSITYLILLHNQEKNLPGLVNSIRNIKGNFRREYIIIDDYSTDNSLEVAKQLFAPFTKTTLLSNKNYLGPSCSINLALKLVSHEYIHFVDAGDILSPNSTEVLLKAVKAMGTEVACSLEGKISKTTNMLEDNIHTTGDTILVESPIKELLDNRRVADIRYIGGSGTIIASKMLEKMSGIDNDVFLHNISLGLRAGKYSKFAFVKQTLYYSSQPQENRYDKDFVAYNSLLAIANFIETNKEIADQYKSEIYKALWSILWNFGRFKVQTLPRYLLSRYIKHNLNLDNLIDLYRLYIGKLEK